MHREMQYWLIYFIMRKLICEIMNIVTKYFDKHCVVIFHWNEDEKEREAFIRKKERMIGEEGWKTLPNKVNKERE